MGHYDVEVWNMLKLDEKTFRMGLTKQCTYTYPLERDHKSSPSRGSCDGKFWNCEAEAR